MIAINIGDTAHNLFGTEEYVMDSIARFIHELLKKTEYKVVLFPMWDRDMVYSRNIQNCFYSKNNRDRVLIKPFDPCPQSMVDFLATCRMTIGMKLHASVLSAAAGVPFISLAYREKCIDFTRSIFNELASETYYVRTDEKHLDEKIMIRYKLVNSIYDSTVHAIKMAKKTYMVKHQEILHHCTTGAAKNAGEPQ